MSHYPVRILLILCALTVGGCSGLQCTRGKLSTQQRIAQFRPLVQAAGVEFGVPQDLIMGVIWVESRFRPGAVSSAGARGLMQLMPGTAEEMATRLGYRTAQPHNPEFSVRAGTAYLSAMLRRFRGDTRLALAAYSTGPGRTKRHLARKGRAPPAGLRYARKVQRARVRFRSAQRQAHRTGPSRLDRRWLSVTEAETLRADPEGGLAWRPPTPSPS